MKWFKFFLPGVLLILLFSCNNQTAEKESGVTVNEEGNFTGIKLLQLNGQPVDWEKYKGKTLFVNFWATWCKPCIEEMPSIQRAKDKVSEKDIVFLLASDEPAEKIEQYKNRNEFDMEFVRVTNLEELGIMALPTTWIFNPDGKKVYSEMGYRAWDDAKNINLILLDTGT